MRELTRRSLRGRIAVVPQDGVPFGASIRESFANGAPRVLIATDVAARGIHVDDVDLVVHFDPPADHKDYLHRSGRTARAGSSGTVVSLVQPDQALEVARLHERARVKARTTHAGA